MLFSERISCVPMTTSDSLDAATRARIAAVPFARTPDFTPEDVLHPWRAWHLARYGGSPIPICYAGQYSHTRLYLGPSRTELGEIMHPEVEGIVNLCELDDLWPLGVDDRRWPRGEGIFGYTWEKLAADAHEVADLIQAGKRVLIHCMAGVNRSPTLTCATIMQVEGIAASTALRRVQRFHPPARPEDRHWQALRQLEIAIQAQRFAAP